jgi:hypothetical protein
MSEQRSPHEQLVARAMKDETFRQQLLNNPGKAVESELGVTLIQVHEDTPTTIHLVLPMQPSASEPHELSEAELDMIVGGAGPVASHGLFTLTGNQQADVPCEFRKGSSVLKKSLVSSSAKGDPSGSQS